MIVFTNGAFDLLHVGHVRLLNFAKSLGHILIVGVNSDESVRRLKGPTRPIIPQDERKDMLWNLKAVDDVIVFEEDSPMELIRQLQPGILVKGPDWAGKEIVGQEVVESWGGKVVVAHHLAGTHTTDIIERIVNRAHHHR